MPIITLSVVSHGHGQLLTDLLNDLSHQTFSSRLKVIVTLNVPESVPDIRGFGGMDIELIINKQPKGFGANHNAALKTATTSWVMIVNPDIRIPDRSLIERLVTRPASARTGLVAPLIRNSQGAREDSVRHNLDPFSLAGRLISSRDRAIAPVSDSHRFVWVAGMFMALPLSVWRDIGGFDERFFLYCEDYDICARLAVQGYDIELDESVEAIHDAQRSSRKSVKYLRWHVTSLLRVWTSAHFWRIWVADLSGTSRR